MAEPLVIDLDAEEALSLAWLNALDRWWAVEQQAWKPGCPHQVCQALRRARRREAYEDTRGDHTPG